MLLNRIPTPSRTPHLKNISCNISKSVI